MLDGASLLLAAVDVDYESRAALCIRSGFLALRHVADFFSIPYDPNSPPTDPISVTRNEFDAALRTMEAAGVPIKADREQAWRDFAGWRVNYDAVLLALCALVWAPPAGVTLRLQASPPTSPLPAHQTLTSSLGQYRRTRCETNALKHGDLAFGQDALMEDINWDDVGFMRPSTPDST